MAGVLAHTLRDGDSRRAHVVSWIKLRRPDMVRVHHAAVFYVAAELRTSWAGGDLRKFSEAAAAFDAALKRLRAVRDGYTQTLIVTSGERESPPTRGA